MNIYYRVIGLLSLALGIIGAFLPLLPTTCFVLLAAWCFAKAPQNGISVYAKIKSLAQSLFNGNKKNVFLDREK
jgi:uncharacterized membrane protein YbaN (DUF454 family)